MDNGNYCVMEYILLHSINSITIFAATIIKQTHHISFTDLVACSNNIERDRQTDWEQAQKPASINGERYIVWERERERTRVFMHLKKPWN